MDLKEVVKLQMVEIDRLRTEVDGAAWRSATWSVGFRATLTRTP
jgi:hypothetical protein